MTTVLHLATSRERPAVRACVNCQHHYDGERRRCCSWSVLHRLAGDKWVFERTACDEALWTPRRSFRRWIYDTFLNMGDAR